MQDAELSLRLQIKAYALLVTPDCKRLKVPRPRIPKQTTKFALFEVQKGRGLHEIEVRNLTTELQSLKGYRLESKNGAWSFPEDIELAPGEEKGIVVSDIGLDPGSEKLSATLNFVALLDTLSLASSQGVECEETVFSAYLEL